MILKITNPCHENWNQMQAVKEGKHCLACNKNVIDFTNFSEEELLNYFSQRTNKVCGRLKPEQLDKVLKKKKENFFQKLIVKYSLILPLMLLEPSESNAQIKGEVEISEHENKQNSLISIDDTQQRDSTKIIKGKVIAGDTKEALPFANVYLKNTNIGTTTDMDGNFELLIPDSLAELNLILVVSYIGYVTREIPITTLTQNSEIHMLADITMDHSVAGGISYHPSLLERIKWRIQSWFD